MMVLDIALLGAARLTLGGSMLKLPRRQPLALLAYLALAGGAVPRDRLAFLLWADAPQDLARRRLRRTLGQLRETLAAAGQAEVIAAEGEAVALDLATCRVDVLEFRRLAQAAGKADVPEAGEQALALYAGPLLEGLSLDDAPELEQWLAAQREHLQHEQQQLMAAVAAAHLTAGRLAPGIALAEALVGADPLREDAQRLLMRLYTADGQRTRALQQYEQCVIALEHELGVQPLPETRALYLALVNGEAAPPATPQSAPANWHTYPTLAVPCFGRETEMAALQGVLRQGLAGRPSVACVSGPAGIGKSRLMQEAAGALGRPVWLSNGQAGGQVIPYAAVLPALRAAIAAHLADTTLPDLWLAEASRVLPEVRLARPGLHRAPDLPLEQAQARLFEALTRLVVDLACVNGGAILALDNLEEADAPSLAWVSNLVNHLNGVPLALVVALRTDEAAPPLAAWLAGLARRGARHDFRVGPLAPPTIAALLQALGVPDAPDAALAARLYEETGGVPLFVLETVRVLREERRRTTDDGRQTVSYSGTSREPEVWPVAETIQEVLRARLRPLSAVERQVAEVCAVLGGGFEDEVVRAVAGRDEAETALALDRLAHRQLLIETERGYRFAHAQVAEVAYQEIGGARRRLLHRRAAEVLRGQAGTPAAVLAQHYERAGAKALAAASWLAAAEQSWQHYAAEPALAAAEHGLRLSTETNERFALLVLREEVLHQLGRREAQARTLEALAALEPGLTAAQAAVVREREGRCYLALSRWIEAEAALRAAVALAPPDDEGAQRLLALALAGQQRWPEAIAAAETALARATDREATAAQGEALRVLAQLARRREDWAACEDYAQRGLALAGVGAALRADLTGDLAEARFWRGHYDSALAQARAAVKLAQAQANRHGEAVAYNLAGRCLTRLNRNAEALAAYGQAREVFVQIENISGQASATGNMGTLAMRLGDLEQAHQHHAEAYRLFDAIGEARGVCIASNNMGAALIWLGRGGEAEPLLRSSLARAQAAGLRVQEAVNLGCLGAALLALDQVEAGIDCMERGLALRRELEHLDACIDAACLAVGYVRAGRLEAAEALSRQALDELATAAGGVAHPQRVFFGRAQVLRALGDEAGAAAALAEAAVLLRASTTALPTATERRRYREAYIFNRDLVEAVEAGRWPEVPRLS